MINSKCPYCGEYNNNNFKITKHYSNSRNVACHKCNGKYNIGVSLMVDETSVKGELEKVLPQDKIETIRNVIKKYLGYQGMGGYENRSKITIDKEYYEGIDYSDNCYSFTLHAKENRYGDEFRYVWFEVTHNDVRFGVHSHFDWKQRSWFHGDTLEEKVTNYIENALVKFKTI